MGSWRGRIVLENLERDFFEKVNAFFEKVNAFFRKVVLQIIKVSCEAFFCSRKTNKNHVNGMARAVGRKKTAVFSSVSN